MSDEQTQLPQGSPIDDLLDELQDLQATAVDKLVSEGIGTSNNSPAGAWNIRNWGNFHNGPGDNNH